MNDFFTYTLSNGIRCIHQRVKSPVAHCSLTIGAGSRDELPGEEGLAHLVEHTLFKGTQRRKAHHINSRLENLGGELNAFTTKEETVVHATTLAADFAKAAELIADVVFRSTFPQREVEKEQSVILDEINSYKDMPQERIWDEFEDIFFAGSPLGHNILGTRASVKRQSRETIARFVGRTHNTDRMVFSSIGNIPERRWRATCERWFGAVEPSMRGFERVAPRTNKPFSKTLAGRNHQAHCLLGAHAPGAYEPQRVALALLVNILGGPAANSLLGVALREKHGLSYAVEAGYAPLCDTGLATIYFSCEKENLDHCIELIDKQLREFTLTPRKLSMARRQFMGQLAIALDSSEGAMLGAGKSYLLYNKVESPAEVRKKIESLTVAQLVEAAAVFARPSTLIYK